MESRGMERLEGVEPTLSTGPLVGLRAWGVMTRKVQGSTVTHLTPTASRFHSRLEPQDWVGYEIERVPWAQPGWVEAECSDGLRPGTLHHPLTALFVEWMAWHPCGLWSVKSALQRDLAFILNVNRERYYQITRARFVLGEVEMAGAVTEHRDGYRAERARPIAFYDLGHHSSHLKKLEDRYEIPVLGAATLWDRWVEGPERETWRRSESP